MIKCLSLDDHNLDIHGSNYKIVTEQINHFYKFLYIFIDGLSYNWWSNRCTDLVFMRYLEITTNYLAVNWTTLSKFMCVCVCVCVCKK